MKFKPIYIIYGSIVLTAVIGVFIFVKRKITPFKKNIVKTAEEEWARFGYDTIGKDGKKIKEGAKEYQEGFWQRVGDYWREALGKRYTGKDRDVAWSSAFISWVMAKSGGIFGIPFKKSSAHATYIREYVKNRKEGRLKAPFVAYRINEKPAEVGDLVCYSREGSSNMYDRTSNYKSHCDIVVKKRAGEIEVIGGNVAQSVSKKIVSTDSLGRVNAGGKWFAIIKNNA
jgi:hypothetical protein